MTLPKDLSVDSDELLRRLSFELKSSNDNGMHKAYYWENSTMKFGLFYDRGYYDCVIVTNKKQFENLYLIKLLRFLKNDADYYKNELIRANLSYTLPPDEYVEVFYNNYQLIKDFLLAFDQEAFDRYYRHEVHYNGI